tara:strand:- start:15996 stop:17435 length:1440 start_codon:yes stop_codon:yes gene_type:complete
MYNGYNKPNKYLAEYKNTYADKQWSHEMITELINCGDDDNCKGRAIKKHKDIALNGIGSIQPFIFDKYEDNAGDIIDSSYNEEVIKKENYFQNTGFPCYNNFGGSYFSFPMMCGTGPCLRYNYIMNNKYGSINLLKNLADNNLSKPDLEITENEWIIPKGDSSFDIIYNKFDLNLVYNDNNLILRNSSIPYVNMALSGATLKYRDGELKIFNEEVQERIIYNCTRTITQHTDNKGIYHKLLITVNIDNFVDYLDAEYTSDITNISEEQDHYKIDTVVSNRFFSKDENKKFEQKWRYILESRLNGNEGLSKNDGKIKTYVKKQFRDEEQDLILKGTYNDNIIGKGQRIKLYDSILDTISDGSLQSDFNFVLLEIDFENYKHNSLKGLNNDYLMDTLFDSEIQCKPIILPASGKCERKYIHTKDYDYIEKNYKHLMDLCAGGEGFKLETSKTNKIYGKLFLGAFAMLILYMLYRIDRKRKN